MSTTRAIFRYFFVCTIYCCSIQHILPQTNALLYTQFQPVQTLSRINRQPQSLALVPQTYNTNYVTGNQNNNVFNTTSNFMTNLEQQQQNYYANKNGNNNRQQQQHLGYLTSTSSAQDGPVEEHVVPPYRHHHHQLLGEPVAVVATDSPGSLTDSYGCPLECQCNKIAQIADCSNRNLSRVPSSFPMDIKRIRLERNNITGIGPYAFQGLKRLQRIDLSNNNLQQIDASAFSGGLQSLNSLILYSNKLENLPTNLFNELSQLQLLLLNANLLQTIHKDLFQTLANLNLLSLYDNNIETLPNGTFDGLKSIKTIHLGKNPLACDCNLRWLAEYFEANPVETSEARCESPRNARVQGKKLAQLSKAEFKCSDPPAAANKGQPDCPIGCVCSGSTVDCSRAGASASQEQRVTGGPSGAAQAPTTYELPDIPDDVPIYVARVHINDQRIKRIRQTGLFRRLANSQKLDLGNNRIVDIEDNAINGQLAGGHKAERVVFVLLENQHCLSPGSSVEGPPVPVDPCAAAPKVNEPHFDSACYNGGICKSTLANSSSAATAAALNYTCICPTGFAGPLCEINIDDCVEHQCQNGAMCVDQVASYKCVCRDPTTSGEFCEQLAPTSGASSSNSISSFPYATSAAAAAALATQSLVAPPLALPIVSTASAASAPAGNSNELSGGGGGSQMLARSADFSPVTRAGATGQQTVPLDQPEARPDGGCQRVTHRSYFDDGNGCQSVRLLKLSTCVGACTTGTCCQAARVKRRRVRMQCNDGASYVKTVDLIKKCSCSSECAPSGGAPLPPVVSNETSERSASDKTKYSKNLTSGSRAAAQASRRSFETAPFSSGAVDEQSMQITRLDAVD